MKKLVSILLAVMLCVSFACAEMPKQHFGFEVLREVYTGENQVISPVSLAYALGMAAQGAEGETKQEILDLLGVDDVYDLAELQKVLEEKGLEQANAAFLAGDMVPREEYVKALEKMFGAEWFENKGNTVAKINTWVKKHTDGMIEKMVEELPAQTALVLVNAIAMEAKWMVEFDPNATWEDVFHAPDGDVTVPFMHNTFHADVGERDGVQMLRLQYRNDDYEPTGLTMLIALPEEGGVEAVLDGLCAEGLEYFVFREEQVKVELSMPKVDIAADNDLGDILKKLGVESAFSDRADFSGISDEALRIGSVLQKARLMMDEEGTKAAAATAVIMVDMAMPIPEEIVEFNMNRPFVLAIADEESGAVSFAGVVANPTSN